MSNFRSRQGFTLVELVVTIAIVGILAAIAIPSYRNYVIRGNRADAQKALLTMAQSMERYFAANNTYCLSCASKSLTDIGVAQSPESGTAVYTITLSNEAATTYTLTATPSTTSVNKTDGCLRIDQTGLRSWNGSQSSTGCGSSFSKSWTDR